MHAFLDSPTFTWIILPVLIFLARICDMSLDTMRIIMIGQGRKLFASLAGFLEITIWLLVARQVIVKLPNPICFFAYAGGFAMGNYVGILIEERLAFGVQLVRVIAPQSGEALVKAIQEEGFGVTPLIAQGEAGPVYVIYSVVSADQVRVLIKLVKTMTPEAFFTVEDVKHVSEGIILTHRKQWPRRLFKHNHS